MNPQDIGTMQNILVRLGAIENSLSNHKHAGFDLSTAIPKDWEILKKITLIAATSSIRADISSRQFLRVFLAHGAKSGVGNTLLRFNNDSGANYTSISQENATARTSATSIDLFDALNSTAQFFFVIDILNISTLQKSVVSEGIQIHTAASDTQVKRQVYGTWINSTDKINRIDIVASANNFPAGTILQVFGSKE